MNHRCLPHAPFIPVKIVTAIEVDELGDDGGLRRLNFVFAPETSTHDLSDGPSWYLCHANRKHV